MGKQSPETGLSILHHFLLTILNDATPHRVHLLVLSSAPPRCHFDVLFSELLHTLWSPEFSSSLSCQL